MNQVRDAAGASAKKAKESSKSATCSGEAKGGSVRRRWGQKSSLFKCLGSSFTARQLPASSTMRRKPSGCSGNGTKAPMLTTQLRPAKSGPLKSCRK